MDKRTKKKRGLKSNRGATLLRMCNVEPPPLQEAVQPAAQPVAQLNPDDGQRIPSPFRGSELDILNDTWKDALVTPSKRVRIMVNGSPHPETPSTIQSSPVPSARNVLRDITDREGGTPTKSVQTLPGLTTSSPKVAIGKENETQGNRKTTSGTPTKSVQTLPGLTTSSPKVAIGKENETQGNRKSTTSKTRNPQLKIGLPRKILKPVHRKRQENNDPPSLELNADESLQANTNSKNHSSLKRPSQTLAQESEPGQTEEQTTSSKKRRFLPKRTSHKSSVARRLDYKEASSESDTESGTVKKTAKKKHCLPLQSHSAPKELTPYQKLRQTYLAENEETLRQFQVQNNLASDVAPSTSKTRNNAGKLMTEILPLRNVSEPSPISPAKSKSGSEWSPSKESDQDLSGNEDEEASSTNDPENTASDNDTEKEQPSSSVQHNDGENIFSENEEGPSSPNVPPPEYDASDIDPRPDSPVKLTERKKREEEQAKRNVGDSYLTRSGNKFRERTRLPPHTCSKNYCQDIIDDDIGETLFVEYWEMGSYERRVQYVAARVESAPVARHRPRTGDGTKNRSNTFYFDIGGERVKICKDTFLKTLDISDTFVESILDKKAENMSGIPRPDKRGKRAPPHKLTDDKKTLMLRHIESFPSYVSHYCRRDTSQKYLPSSLNLKEMHRLYLEKHSTPEESVSYSSYQRIFKTLKLKFHQRLSDTCSKCDTFVSQIKNSTGEVKTRHEKEYQLHLRKAEKAYALKKEIKLKAEDDDTLRVLVFDLEQCLPTPDLKCGTVYYKRQLYTYNLTIYDTTTKLCHCYMWHEAEGMRGANEVASCLFEHIRSSIPSGVTQIVLFSDCCSGQNRNSIVCAMFQVALQVHPTVKKIDHIFLVPGHTRMECDAKHAAIERAKRKQDVINVPSDYYKLVEKAGMVDLQNFPEGKFKVIQMKSKLYDFSALLEQTNPLIKRLKTTSKQDFKYMSTHWFRYDKRKPGSVMVKTAFNTDAPFDELSFRRNRKKSDLPDLFPLLKLAHEGPMPIAALKKQDLLSLLTFIDPCHHPFYRNLITVDIPASQIPHPDTPAEGHLDDDLEEPEED